MDPRRWIAPQADNLLNMLNHSLVTSSSWMTRLLVSLRTMSSRLWVIAKGAHITTWLLILLLPAVPAGFVIKYSNQTPAATFMSNLVAMVPLGVILTLLTDEMITRRGGHEALLVIVTTGFATFPYSYNKLDSSTYTSRCLGILYNWLLRLLP